jgi:hypothetical protein
VHRKWVVGAQATDTEQPGPPRGEGGSGILTDAVDAARTEIGNQELPWIFLVKSGPMERILLTHYVRERGAPLELTRDMMGELTNGRLAVFARSRETLGTPNTFEQAVIDLSAAGGGTLDSFHGASSPDLNGVGEAGAVWDGRLDVAADGSWTFVGTVSLTDTWDFDARQWGFRGAELVNRVAAGALWGTPFRITSTRVPVSVSSTSGVATFDYNRLPRGGRPSSFDLATGAPFVWVWGVSGGVLTIFTGDFFPHPNQGSRRP